MRLSPRTPLSIRSTALMPVVSGLLAFSNRSFGLGGSGLKGLRSAHFIGIRAVERFRTPLKGQIARKGFLEVRKDVSLRHLVADVDVLRGDAERPEPMGESVLSERLPVPA